MQTVIPSKSGEMKDFGLHADFMEFAMTVHPIDSRGWFTLLVQQLMHETF